MTKIIKNQQFVIEQLHPGFGRIGENAFAIFLLEIIDTVKQFSGLRQVAVVERFKVKGTMEEMYNESSEGIPTNSELGAYHG